MKSEQVKIKREKIKKEKATPLGSNGEIKKENVQKQSEDSINQTENTQRIAFSDSENSDSAKQIKPIKARRRIKKRTYTKLEQNPESDDDEGLMHDQDFLYAKKAPSVPINKDLSKNARNKKRTASPSESSANGNKKRSVEFSSSDDDEAPPGLLDLSRPDIDSNTEIKRTRQLTPPPEKYNKSTAKAVRDAKELVNQISKTNRKNSEILKIHENSEILKIHKNSENLRRQNENETTRKSAPTEVSRRLQIGVKLDNEGTFKRYEFLPGSKFSEIIDIIKIEERFDFDFDLELDGQVFQSSDVLSDQYDSIALRPLSITRQVSDQEEVEDSFWIVFKWGTKESEKIEIDCEETETFRSVASKFAQKTNIEAQSFIFDGDRISEGEFVKTLKDLDIDSEDCIEVRKHAEKHGKSQKCAVF